jgi:hypothetical protein
MLKEYKSPNIVQGTYPQILAIHKRIRGTPTVRVPYVVAADAYILELERQLELESAFVEDIQFTKGKILRLISKLEHLT